MAKRKDISDKKEWAQYLYCEEGLMQKEIAKRTGISEKTICDWKGRYLWEERRKSLLITRKQQLSTLYNQLDSINTKIREQQNNVPTTKDTDSILKLTAAIKNLETEISVADVFEVGKRFISFIQAIDFEKSKELVDYYDAFIKQCLKRN